MLIIDKTSVENNQFSLWRWLWKEFPFDAHSLESQIKNWKWFLKKKKKTWKFENVIFDEREVPSYVDNDPNWWYKRRTCAGMNHYLITRRERRISRDRTFDEPIGRKKIGILAHRCTATANRVSPRCSRRRLSTTDDNKSLPGAFPSHDVLRDARHADRARIINYFLPDAYKRAPRAYPRIIRVRCASRSRWMQLSGFSPEKRERTKGDGGGKGSVDTTIGNDAK